MSYSVQVSWDAPSIEPDPETMHDVSCKTVSDLRRHLIGKLGLRKVAAITLLKCKHKADVRRVIPLEDGHLLPGELLHLKLQAEHLETHNPWDRVDANNQRPPKIPFALAFIVIGIIGFGSAEAFSDGLGTSNAAGAITLVGTQVVTAGLSILLWRFINHELCQTGGISENTTAPVIQATATGDPNTPAKPRTECAPRPLVTLALTPDRAYLQRCAAAAAELERALQQASESNRENMKKFLREKYSLRWDVESLEGDTMNVLVNPAVQDEGVAIFDPKKLFGLVMRYPESALPLAQGHFSWSKPPIRAGGEAAVERALQRWTETTTSAADSALFSSMGFWISPISAPLCLLTGLGFLISAAITNYETARTNPFYNAGNLFTSLAFLLSAHALYKGRWLRARWCWATCFVCQGLLMGLESAFSLCRCLGPYAHAQNATGAQATAMNHSWQWAWRVGTLSVMSFVVVVVASHPRQTPRVFFAALPCGYVISALPYAITNYALFRTNVAIAARICSLLSGLGAYLQFGRFRALSRAKRLGDEDIARYNSHWERATAESGFLESLQGLEDAWNAVQSRAIDLHKRQSAPTLHALLGQADVLNDLLAVKLFDLCEAHGGALHPSLVKGLPRALQKTFRSYNGDWRKLCDLCRSSLVFDKISNMESCLRAIGADNELEVVRAAESKMRIRMGFNAGKESGGYRDIQLCVRLNNADTRSVGVHEHLAEVQLHFTPILALKSDGGHTNYVLRRNLQGK